LEFLLNETSSRSRSIPVGIFPSLDTNEERSIASFESIEKTDVNNVSLYEDISCSGLFIKGFFWLKATIAKNAIKILQNHC